MYTKKDIDKIIQNCFKKLNFDLILQIYQNNIIKYPFDFTGTLTVDIIKKDLYNIVNKSISDLKWETINNHWLIYYNPNSLSDSAINLQIFFTPICSHYYYFKKNLRKKEYLEFQKEEALNSENYELANILNKRLQEIELEEN